MSTYAEVMAAREYLMAELIYSETTSVAKTLPFDRLPAEAQQGYLNLVRRIVAEMDIADIAATAAT